MKSGRFRGSRWPGANFIQILINSFEKIERFPGLIRFPDQAIRPAVSKTWHGTLLAAIPASRCPSKRQGGSYIPRWCQGPTLKRNFADCFLRRTFSLNYMHNCVVIRNVCNNNNMFASIWHGISGGCVTCGLIWLQTYLGPFWAILGASIHISIES